MRGTVRTAGVVVAVAGVVLAMNLFARELNALFLKYPGIDKVLHVFGYLLVYVVVYVSAERMTPDEGRRQRLAATVGVLLSILDESVQQLAPGRSVEAFDMVANLAGLGLGWVLVRRRGDSLAFGTVALALCAASYVTWDTHVRLMDYSRALQYAQQQDFVRAREHLLRALDGGMRSPGLFNELGWVEIESGIGDPGKAVEYAKTALDMQPGNPDILDTYGWALHHAGRTADAVEMLERAYAANPNIFCIHYHLGSAYLAVGRREQAAFHFRRQVERQGTREAVFAKQALARMDTTP